MTMHINGAVSLTNSIPDSAPTMVGNPNLLVDADYRGNISINDLDMAQGQVLNIVSPYYTGTPASQSLVHPSVIRHSRGVDGSPYLMMVTPFAGANDATENPCVFVSDDLLTWRTPTGLTNPIDATPPAGYNSDCQLYEHTDGYTYALWREYVNGGNETIYASRSYDGITWAEGYPILRDSVATQGWISPSFWHDGTQWVIISHNVNASNAIRKMTKTGDLFTSWMGVTPTTITPTHPNGLSWWHSDIRRLPSGRLIGLVLEGGPGGGPSGILGGGSCAWLWQSDNNGTTWSVRQLTRGKINYRSTLVLDKSKVSIILVWVDSNSGSPNYTEMYLHHLRPGRLERRKTQANLRGGLIYGQVLDDEQNVLVHCDGFVGTAADLSSPWSQVTGVAMRRNGSGAAAAAGTGASGAIVACGSVDHWAQVQILNYTSGTMWLLVKAIDASNFVAVGIIGATGEVVIKGFVAGSATLDEAVSVTPTLASGIVLRASVDGLWLRTWADGVLFFERTIPSALATGSNAGIYAIGPTTNTFDVFACGRL